MEGFVADASIGIAWAVESQSSAETKDLLDRVASGVSFVVPVLWPFEVANAMLVLVRRRRMTTEDFARARLDFGTAKPVIDTEGPRFAWSDISHLAEQFALTI